MGRNEEPQAAVPPSCCPSRQAVANNSPVGLIITSPTWNEPRWKQEREEKLLLVWAQQRARLGCVRQRQGQQGSSSSRCGHKLHPGGLNLSLPEIKSEWPVIQRQVRGETRTL